MIHLGLACLPVISFSFIYCPDNRVARVSKVPIRETVFQFTVQL